MEKENRAVERRIEEKIYCHSYDSLVREMAKSMELDTDKLFPKEGDDFNYEDINSWIGAVNLQKDQSPSIEFSISSDQGKSEVHFETKKIESIQDPDKATSKEELLYSMALTEAKMRTVSKIAEDTYPAISSQIEEYKKQMELVRDEVLGNKKNNESLDEMLNRVVSRRGMLLASAMVISSLVLSACGVTVQPVEGYVPTSTRPNKATATEVFSKPFPSKTAEPTVTPTKTATPTEAPTPTETEIPLLEVKTTWNEGETAEDFPKCALEDIESGLYAKSVWRAVEKMPGFSKEVWQSDWGQQTYVEREFKAIALGNRSNQKYNMGYNVEEPEFRPMRGVAVCETKINEASVVVITFQILQPYGSTRYDDATGFHHFEFEPNGSSDHAWENARPMGLMNIALENDEDTVMLEWFRKTFLGYTSPVFVYEMTMKTWAEWLPKVGVGHDFHKERNLAGYIVSKKEEISPAVDRFIETGKMDLEKYLFSLLFFRKAY